MSNGGYYDESYPPSLWEAPASTVTLLAPSTAVVGAAGFTLTINGTGFTDDSEVSFDGDLRATTFVSDTQLTAPVGSPVGPARTVQVTVSTGGTSPFTITAAQEEPQQEEPPPEEYPTEAPEAPTEAPEG